MGMGFEFNRISVWWRGSDTWSNYRDFKYPVVLALERLVLNTNVCMVRDLRCITGQHLTAQINHRDTGKQLIVGMRLTDI